MPEYLNMPPQVLTDSSGAYRFRVPDSDGYCLFVIPSDAVAQSIPIQRDYGVHPVLRLEKGTEISGRVLDVEGQPLAGVVVQANGSDSIYDGFKEPMARVLTDADGRYELPPQRLPVDVRVAALGWRGGWEERGRDLSLDQVYSPTMVRNPLTTLDFKPCESVMLTAMVYDNDGRPAKDCELTVFGFVPGTAADNDDRGCIWRGRFQEVPEHPGKFQLKAPKGLLNATLRDAEIPAGPRQSWSRAVRNDDDSAVTRTNAGWKVLDSDDNSIIIGQPSAPQHPSAGVSAKYLAAKKEGRRRSSSAVSCSVCSLRRSFFAHTSFCPKPIPGPCSFRHRSFSKNIWLQKNGRRSRQSAVSCFACSLRCSFFALTSFCPKTIPGPCRLRRRSFSKNIWPQKKGRRSRQSAVSCSACSLRRSSFCPPSFCQKSIPEFW